MITLREIFDELEDQKYEMYGTMIIDYDDVLTAVKRLEKELKEKCSHGSIEKCPFTHWITVEEILGK